MISPSYRDKVNYIFGHMVASYELDAHAADSGDLAYDLMDELDFSQDMQDLLVILAENVHGNFTYTGEADEFNEKIRRGEV